MKPTVTMEFRPPSRWPLVWQQTVWAIDSGQFGIPQNSGGPAVLHAYDATNLATELWNSLPLATVGTLNFTAVPAVSRLLGA